MMSLTSEPRHPDDRKMGPIHRIFEDKKRIGHFGSTLQAIVDDKDRWKRVPDYTSFSGVVNDCGKHLLEIRAIGDDTHDPDLLTLLDEAFQKHERLRSALVLAVQQRWTVAERRFNVPELVRKSNILTSCLKRLEEQARRTVTRPVRSKSPALSIVENPPPIPPNPAPKDVLPSTKKDENSRSDGVRVNSRGERVFDPSKFKRQADLWNQVLAEMQKVSAGNEKSASEEKPIPPKAPSPFTPKKPEATAPKDVDEDTTLAAMKESEAKYNAKAQRYGHQYQVGMGLLDTLRVPMSDLLGEEDAFGFLRLPCVIQSRLDEVAETKLLEDFDVRSKLILKAFTLFDLAHIVGIKTSKIRAIQKTEQMDLSPETMGAIMEKMCERYDLRPQVTSSRLLTELVQDLPEKSVHYLERNGWLPHQMKGKTKNEKIRKIERVLRKHGRHQDAEKWLELVGMKRAALVPATEGMRVGGHVYCLLLPTDLIERVRVRAWELLVSQE